MPKKVMIVTGASSGIGRELALQAAARGYRVLLVARRAERLQQVVSEIRVRGGECDAIVADVVTKSAPAQIVSKAREAFGQIDVVVNNAGVGAPGGLLEQSDAAIEAQWQLHVAAPLRIARAALADVARSHGGFVFFGSGLARVPAPGFGAYCAAKAAARATAIQLRRELRPRKIFVTYVDPGAVATEFNAASGMQETATHLHAKPAAVAKRILRGIEGRAARVNAVPWQTAGTILGEWFPWLADAAMARIVARPDEARRVEPAPQAPIAAAEPAPPPESTTFDSTIEPLRRRMERVKLPETFVRELLVPDSQIALSEAAMRWAGMPNKNERAAMSEVFHALAENGFLESTGEDIWTVRRPAD